MGMYVYLTYFFIIKAYKNYIDKSYVIVFIIYLFIFNMYHMQVFVFGLQNLVIQFFIFEEISINVTCLTEYFFWIL